MQAPELYKAMQLPDDSALGKRVYKKLFRENASLTASDKRALKQDVESITWQYTLKPSTLPIQPYVDAEREYLEVAVLEVQLRGGRHAARIAEVVHRAIPYPVVVVLLHGDALAVSLAHKRFSQAEHGAVVAEDALQTPWLGGEERTPAELEFLASLKLQGLPQTHFYGLYSALMARVLALVCADLTGRFALKDGEPEEVRRGRLDRCRRLRREAAEIKTAIKEESSFARQVELNTRLKELKRELAEAAANL